MKIKKWNKFNEDVLSKNTIQNDEDLINKMSRLLSDTFYPGGSKVKLPIKCNGYTNEGYDYEVYFSVYNEEKGDYIESSGINTIIIPSFLFDDETKNQSDFYKLNGMIIETVDYDISVKIKTNKGEFEIYSINGWNVEGDTEEENEPTLPQKVISVDFDGHEVTIELENGEELFFVDTGEEGLEIWKTK